MRGRLDRRTFLKYSAAAGAAASATTLLGACTTAATSSGPDAAPSSTVAADGAFRWHEATIAGMQDAMASGEATALDIVRDHIGRVEALDWAGPMLNSVIELNPDAESIAADLDRERAEGHVRGPLHGIPIMLKDAVATDDRMQTTAGSLALVGAKVPRDAGLVARLRDAGVILLGKNNMSEWNAFRGWPLHGGWSARAGMGLNPYWLNTSTGDSSSGSAAAVSAGLCAGAVGLETYGSIVMPASLCGIVGLKPTVGLVRRSGTIGISITRDVLGPMARTVADVAALLGGMAGGFDPLDPATAAAEGHVPPDYQAFLDPDGLRGARIGVWRREDLWKDDAAANAVIEALFPVLRDLGAEVIDPVEIPHWLEATGEHIGVMFSEFRPRIERYLAELRGTDVRTLEDVIAFNEDHARQELHIHSQNTLESASDQPPLDDPIYLRSKRVSQQVAREGFANVMRTHRLDAILSPTFRRAWQVDLLAGDDPENGNGAAGPSNAAGYPHITLPAGFVDGLPIGVSFMAEAWEEPKLLRYSYALEQATEARNPPRFLEGYNVREFVPRG
jgi:amidase